MDTDLEKQKENEQEKIYEYKRPSLILTDSNKLLNMLELKLLDKLFDSEKLKKYKIVNLSHLFYYHYNCESVNDSGWGCAWRSLQTCLRFQLSLSNSIKEKDISFKNLFLSYGKKNKLIDIYKQMSKDLNKDKNIEILSKKVFAPFENPNGWAEPFISQLILYDFGFEGELILINFYNTSSYAPKEVFNRTITFKEFINILENHFSTKNSPPIILDDSVVSICIIGIKINKEKETINLIIMDPHSSNIDTKIGLYIIKLDFDGKFIKIIPNEHILESKKVFFFEKSWMVYIPNTIKDN